MVRYGFLAFLTDPEVVRPILRHLCIPEHPLQTELLTVGPPESARSRGSAVARARAARRPNRPTQASIRRDSCRLPPPGPNRTTVRTVLPRTHGPHHVAFHQVRPRLDFLSVIFGDGEQTRDFTYIDNVVKANLMMADAPPT